MYSKPRGPKRLYYQKISIRIDELENKVGLPLGASEDSTDKSKIQEADLQKA